jgi:hypothetical protein
MLVTGTIPSDLSQYRVISGVLTLSPTAPTLARAKVDQLTVLKSARDGVVFGGFTWSGSTFDSDQTAQTRLMGLYVNAQSNPSLSQAWRLADNSWRTISAADAAAVWASLTSHLATQFSHFATKEAAVNAAADVAAVLAVVW